MGRDIDDLKVPNVLFNKTERRSNIRTIFSFHVLFINLLWGLVIKSTNYVFYGGDLCPFTTPSYPYRTYFLLKFDLGYVLLMESD